MRTFPVVKAPLAAQHAGQFPFRQGGSGMRQHQSSLRRIRPNGKIDRSAFGLDAQHKPIRKLGG